MKKLLFITYFWPPSGKATLHWPLKIIKHLPEFNWEPTVLTTEEDPSSYKDESLLKEVSSGLKVFKTKSVEPFRIYKRFTGKKKDEPLISSETVSSENQSIAQKLSLWIRFNIFIPDARVGWFLSAIPKGKKILTEANYQVIVSLGPPHSAHLIGYHLSKKFNIPHIPVLIDPWTDIIYYKSARRTKAAKRIDSLFEKKVLENAGAVVFVTKSTREDYINKYSFLKEKSHFLYWGYNEEDFRMENGKWKMENGKKEEVIVHAGNIFDYQNPKKLWTTIGKEINTGRNLKLKFIGTVSPLIRKEIENNNLTQITEYAGFLPYSEMIMKLLKADFLLVCATEKRHVPGKLFEYLRAGKPILAFGDDNEEVKQIISEANAGMIFKYDEDCKEFFDKANSFQTDQSIIKKYERKIIAQKFAEIVNSI
jgi:glycosyltransferase involved in cell wall biosynthesis